MQKNKFKSKDELLDFLDDKAEWLRREIIRLSSIAGGSHLGGGLSMADIIVAVYYHALNLKEGDPTVARSGPLHPLQGARRHRLVPGAGRPGFLFTRVAQHLQ